MNENGNSVIGGAPARPDEMEARIFRVMALAVTVAVMLSAVLAPWRVTTGLLLGGLLSLVNFRWLHGSVAALLTIPEGGKAPRFGLSKYVFRYLVIAVSVFTAYKFGWVSLPAVIAGLCSFVPALFFEAFRQFYFAIIRREESF